MSRALRQPALGRAGMEGEALPPRHFLDLCDFEPATLRQILDVASGFKQAGRVSSRPLAGRTLAMIFERPSTRTRVSFEVAMRQLGGDAVVLSGAELQLGRGETIGDTARALSRYVDAIMLRTNDPAKLHALAEHARFDVADILLRQMCFGWRRISVEELFGEDGSVRGDMVHGRRCG